MNKFLKVKALRPHPNSVKARLPEVYQKYVKSLNETPTPVHYIPNEMKYELSPLTGER